MFRKHKRPVGSSWRVGETSIKVKGVWKYLYRAVDKEAKSVSLEELASVPAPNTFINEQRERTEIATAMPGLT